MFPKYALSALLLTLTTLLPAQSDTSGTTFKRTVFAQAAVGLLPHPGFICAEISGAAGYQLTPGFGIGVDYRYTSSANESFGDEAKLLGLHLRLPNRHGFFAGVGGGFVLSASKGYDGFDSFEYRKGGNYLATDLGYQFRFGLTLGFYGTMTFGHRHEHIRYNLDTDVWEATGRIEPENFGGLGFKVGYGLPLRRRGRGL